MFLFDNCRHKVQLNGRPVVKSGLNFLIEIYYLIYLRYGTVRPVATSSDCKSLTRVVNIEGSTPSRPKKFGVLV